MKTPPFQDQNIKLRPNATKNSKFDKNKNALP